MRVLQDLERINSGDAHISPPVAVRAVVTLNEPRESNTSGKVEHLELYVAEGEPYSRRDDEKRKGGRQEDGLAGIERLGLQP